MRSEQFVSWVAGDRFESELPGCGAADVLLTHQLAKRLDEHLVILCWLLVVVGDRRGTCAGLRVLVLQRDWRLVQRRCEAGQRQIRVLVLGAQRVGICGSLLVLLQLGLDLVLQLLQLSGYQPDGLLGGGVVIVGLAIVGLVLFPRARSEQAFGRRFQFVRLLVGGLAGHRVVVVESAFGGLVLRPDCRRISLAGKIHWTGRTSECKSIRTFVNTLQNENWNPTLGSITMFENINEHQ